MDDADILSKCLGFDWDQHNARKNWEKHRATPAECEEVLLNLPLVVRDDSGRSEKETRFFALGQTSAARKLFMVFTIRGELIRVISARDMHRREWEAYRS
jgi:uncharacterized DUF497 family protein